MNYPTEKVNTNFLNKIELAKINKKMEVKRQVAIIESMKAKFNRLLTIENERLEYYKKKEQQANTAYEIANAPIIKPYNLNDDLPK